MVDTSNQGKDNKVLARDERAPPVQPRQPAVALGRLVPDGTTYLLDPLRAHTVAAKGGNTEFANMCAAYDDLDADTKAEIESLICEQSQLYSRGAFGFSELTGEERRAFAPVRQCLVRVHPATGRKSLYLSSHIGSIMDRPVPKGRAFIRELTEHAVQPKYVYAHRWQPDDLVMWDNRQTIHRVRR